MSIQSRSQHVQRKSAGQQGQPVQAKSRGDALQLREKSYAEGAAALSPDNQPSYVQMAAAQSPVQMNGVPDYERGESDHAKVEPTETAGDKLLQAIEQAKSDLDGMALGTDDDAVLVKIRGAVRPIVAMLSKSFVAQLTKNERGVADSGMKAIYRAVRGIQRKMASEDEPVWEEYSDENRRLKTAVRRSGL